MNTTILGLRLVGRRVLILQFLHDFFRALKMMFTPKVIGGLLRIY